VSLDLSNLMFAVIDDSKMMRHIVSSILHKCNAGCILEAENGAEALAQFELVQPNIIFCDWVMQPISGIEFLRTIRSGESKIDPQTPIIMMTSQVEMPFIIEAKEAGVTGYLAKPVSMSGVIARLTAVLNGGADVRPRTLHAVPRIATGK